MWISHGVPLVWALYPDSRSIDVHTPDAPRSILTDADALDGGNILPGFTCKVSDIFDTDL